MSAAATTANLLDPLTIRGVTFRNRIVMSPMCQYSPRTDSPTTGTLSTWAAGRPAGSRLVVVEATAVTARRAGSPPATWASGATSTSSPSPGSPGSSTRREPCAGIQLAHAGRKASCDLPGPAAPAENTGAGRLAGRRPEPDPLSSRRTRSDRARRRRHQRHRRRLRGGRASGIDGRVFALIEIHAAHGYLLHEFLSPLSAIAATTHTAARSRTERGCPSASSTPSAIWCRTNCPLFLRISATDWVDGGWDADDSVALATLVSRCGIDLIDVSSGALVPEARIPVAKGFQCPSPARFRDEAGSLPARSA